MLQVPLIKSHFLSLDAKAILSQPLPSQPWSDSLLWHYNKDGVYSVKSGYWLAERLISVTSSSSFSSLASWWLFVWSIQLPSKIRVFVWKLCNGVVPSLMNLAHHKVSIPNQCREVCLHVEETSLHVVWMCPSLRPSREACGFSFLPLSGIVPWCKSFLVAFAESNSKELLRRVDRLVHWIPPIHGAFKINTYAALDFFSGNIGLGV
ncbi:hypothetical protein ACOSQ3_029748 [Xanthoceras sorbifolium]